MNRNTEDTSRTEASASSETLRILLLDDHPHVRLSMRILISQNYPNTNVAEASTADEALRLLRQSDFDLVFLDIEIPQSDAEPHAIPEVGKSTLTAIREMDGPPVVVMSARTDPELINDMMSRGAPPYCLT